MTLCCLASRKLYRHRFSNHIIIILLLLIITRSLPHYLSDIFTFTHDIHIHETRQASHIRPFTSLTVKSTNSFLCKGPLIWNRIPFSIQEKNIQSVAVSLKAIVVYVYEELAEAYSI